jgi:hypothetical protein
MVIEVGPEQAADPPASNPGRRYSLLVVLLASALCLTAGLLVGTIRPSTTPPARTVTVEAGLSEYPAEVTAAWWDKDGHRGTLDPWIGQEVRLDAVRVVVAVAFTGDPIQCTLKINGGVVDTQSANAAGQVAVCMWAATP